MGFVITSTGKIWQETPIIKETQQQIIYQTVTHTAPDPTGGTEDHQIVLDATAPNTDKSHIYLEGIIPADDYFLRCYNPSKDDATGNADLNDVFWIDGDGSIRCNQIFSPEFETVENKITALETLTGTTAEQGLLALLNNPPRSMIGEILRIDGNFQVIKDNVEGFNFQALVDYTDSNDLTIAELVDYTDATDLTIAGLTQTDVEHAAAISNLNDYIGSIPTLQSLSTPPKSIIGEIVNLYSTTESITDAFTVQLNGVADTHAEFMQKFDGYNTNWGFSSYLKSEQDSPHTDKTFLNQSSHRVPRKVK